MQKVKPGDKTAELYCCECAGHVVADLTSGAEVYSHRPDLAGLPFWKCRTCGNFVGCHHKTQHRTRPLGCIPNKPMKELRKRIHAELDPLWQSGQHQRRDLYARLGKVIGRSYHTAELRTLAEARLVLDEVEKIARGSHAWMAV